ncbi:hypothetical protein FACS189465_1230 [Clostridia bacterium]|nr:hypothetical protein FACS189465_1230 [Clostridia bacterium]
MKNNTKCFAKKTVLGLLLTTSLFFASGERIYADIPAGASNIKYNGSTLMSNAADKETRLGNNIIKKESVSCIDHVYKGALEKNPYQYSTARMEISYVNGEDKTLAQLFFEIDFRFNPITEEAKCLSTPEFSVDFDKNSKLEVDARRENETTELGGGFVQVKFKNNNVTDNCTYEFKCNHKGEIKSRII